MIAYLLWRTDPLTINRDKVKDTIRHSPILFIILVISIVGLAGCEVAGDIFKAGVWVGAILVIGIIGLVIWMFSKGGI